MVQATLETRAPAVLRPYQREALRALVDYRINGGSRALITLATGLGKTTIFSQLARSQKRMLVIAHREELLDQAAERIAADIPGVSIGIEQANRRSEGNEKVLVASVQKLALSAGRLERLDPSDFSVVVVDEAHHVLARTYLDVLAHFGLVPDVHDLSDAQLSRKEVSHVVAERFRSHRVPGGAPYLVGCTATPNRTDKKGLEWAFDDIVYAMDIRAGIEQGWLSPIRGVRITTGTSIANVATRGGDFVESQLSNAVNNDARNALIVHAYEDYAVSENERAKAMLFDGTPSPRKSKQALVFCADAKHAEAVTETFQRRGHATGIVLGTTPTKERRSTVAAYRRGDLRVLVGVMVFTEGFDAPETEIVIMARPTKSSLVYTQALGRATRKAEGKPYALIIDLMDAAKSSGGVQDLNTMFGLPPKLDLSGTDTVTALRVVEEHEADISQQRLLDAESLADVERMATEFDPMALSGLPAAVEARTRLAWTKIPSGYILGLIGRGDIGVVTDLLGHASVRFKPKAGASSNFINEPGHSNKPVEVGHYDDEYQALEAAENWVYANHSDIAGLSDRHASWRTENTPLTVNQASMLKRLRVDYPVGITKGQASVLIGKALAKKGK
jgi:ATP-dependent helicase IRC3